MLEKWLNLEYFHWKNFNKFISLIFNVYIFGVLKKPLEYKNIVIPIIGPKPKIKRTNFAEFFVWPNSSFFLFKLDWTFFDFLFFMRNILQHSNCEEMLVCD